MKQYYYYKNKERFGPLSLEELLDSDINESTLIWHEGLSNWVKAKELQELDEKINNNRPPLPNSEVLEYFPQKSKSHLSRLKEDFSMLSTYPILSINWFLDGVTKNYFNFKGRARRREFWSFQFYHFFIIFILGMVGGVTSETYLEESTFPFIIILFFLYFLFIIIPMLAIQVRRLHDTGNSGWLLLISFIPYLGGLILFIIYCMDSSKGRNLYGPNPKGIENYY